MHFPSKTTKRIFCSFHFLLAVEPSVIIKSDMGLGLDVPSNFAETRFLAKCNAFTASPNSDQVGHSHTT